MDTVKVMSPQHHLIENVAVIAMSSNIAKYTIFQSKDDNVLLTSHFSTPSFTTTVFDNFDNADKNSLYGTKHAHITAVTTF